MHTPVLLQKVIENLDIRPNLLYVDATVGEGGHLQEILNKKGKVLAIDADENQVSKLKMKFKSFITDKRLIVVKANFSNLADICKKNDFFEVSGIIVDLGLSYEQISSSGRGFSYMKPYENLDMRIDIKKDLTASDIVNNFKADELYEIFSKFSEDINSRSIAESIVRARAVKKILKVKDLIEVINKTLGEKDTQTIARIFQALRIKTNDEIENLKKLLYEAPKVLQVNGRMLIITFHSTEDRVVKSFVKNTLLFKQEQIIKGNRLLSYERSAKLRILVKN